MADSREQTVYRSLFTKDANVLTKLLEEKAPVEDVNAKYQLLSARYAKLEALQDAIVEEMFGDEKIADVSVIEQALEKNGDYSYKFFQLKERVEELNGQGTGDKASVVGNLPAAEAAVPSPLNQLSLKMKREIRQFDGRICNWIRFWSQFRQIHENVSLSDDVKFDFLLQYIEPGSLADRLLENFPPSGENYAKAVDLLKSRFGKDESLIEFYVREILALVLSCREVGNVSAFYDKLEAQLRALESLGTTKDKCAAILFPLVESAVPADIFRTWERRRVEKGASMADPSACLTELMSFLKVEVESEERMALRDGSSLQVPGSCSAGPMSTGNNDTSASTAASLIAGAEKRPSGPGNQCVFCEKSHENPQECTQAADLTLEERFDVLKKKKGCFRCLKRGHQSQKCVRFVRCIHCKGRHFPLLCGKVSLTSSEDKKETPKADSTVAFSASSFKGPTYLQTCRATLTTPAGMHEVRVLLDSGSQQSYITYKLACKTGLRPTGRIELTQKLFGGKETAPRFHKLYQVELTSLDGTFQGKFGVIGQDCICDFSPPSAGQSVFEALGKSGILLTDHKPPGSHAEEIDLLLGSDSWPQLITNHIVNVNPDLVAIRTSLGWTLLGLASQDRSMACNLVFTLSCQTHPSHFWDLEMLGIHDPAEVKKQAAKDEEVVRFFKETVTRDEDGRMVVRLPWVECRPQIADNRKAAEKRLHSTTLRLRKMGHLEDYDLVLREWLKKGIIEKVNGSEDNLNNTGRNSQDIHYLPHRAVIKEGGTTKIRPVFDASNKDVNGISLNTLLEAGPNLIELIPIILTNFRLFKVGVSADIESAFLQIALASADRDMLRFLWWEDGKMITFRHCRVVFGVSCSPFLLGAVLNHILDTADASQKPLAQKLKKSFYVDNLLCGVDDEQELDNFIENSRRLLNSAGFNLRRWVDSIHNPDKVESALGLSWYCGCDQLGCNLERLDGLPVVVTKRILLSISQRLHDPIGFTAPASLLPKLIYQEACEKKLNWDDQLPKELVEPFEKWVSDINHLDLCRIPRRIIMNDTSTLHVCCDASKRAFACCVFVRTETENGVQVSLILAKTRVAPAKITSIPRLELLAALIGVRVSNMAKRGLNQSLPTYYWSDSAVVVDWIKGNGKWSVFVHNRVKEIVESAPPAQWRHIPGSVNPADLLSRGCSPSQLVESKWWEGPGWLRLNPEDWPVSFELPDEIEVNRERKKTAQVNSTLIKHVFSLTRCLAELCSSYSRIVRRILVISKFLTWKFPSFKRGPQSGEGNEKDEFLDAEKVVFRAIQRECVSDRTEKGALKNLSVFKDAEGLIRLKTRILEDGSTDDYQSPVILPADHALVVRLIEEEHRKTHAGVATLLVTFRERIWLLKGRQTIAKVVRRCLVCKKQRAKPLDVPFPPLPSDRTTVTGTFQTTGLDLAGPLHLKSGEKAWIVIFTCAVYRAVHLELVFSLSSETLIQALRRFVARRGRPSTLYSDNGTNFVGLENTMSALNWEALERECNLQRIKWKFNVPTGAWWGGFWERLIRVLKDLLRKNLGHAQLDSVEMYTLLCDCEAVMNSRPLTYVSEDPNELNPLTPAMFLMSLPHNEVGDLDNIEPVSLRSRLRYVQELRQGLRSRFKKEYLGFLRSSAEKRTDAVAVGDVVLVESEKKRLQWLMAKVVEVRPGRDGITRVARLRTACGELVRPVQRLYPLEIRANDSETATAMDDQSDQVNENSTSSESEDSNSAEEEKEAEDGSANSSVGSSSDLATASSNVAPSPPVHSRVGRRIKPRDVLDL